MAGNPDIVEIGKNTRFGAPNGVNPKIARQKGNAPWSVRNAIRRIAAMDVGDFDLFIRQPNNVTLAYAVAIKKFQKAINGDLNAMQQIEDAIDGKLSKNSNKDKGLYFKSL